MPSNVSGIVLQELQPAIAFEPTRRGRLRASTFDWLHESLARTSTADSPLSRYALRHQVAHRLACGQASDAHRAATDLDRLVATLQLWPEEGRQLWLQAEATSRGRVDGRNATGTEAEALNLLRKSHPWFPEGGDTALAFARWASESPDLGVQQWALAKVSEIDPLGFWLRETSAVPEEPHRLVAAAAVSEHDTVVAASGRVFLVQRAEDVAKVTCVRPFDRTQCEFDLADDLARLLQVGPFLLLIETGPGQPVVRCWDGSAKAASRHVLPHTGAPLQVLESPGSDNTLLSICSGGTLVRWDPSSMRLEAIQTALRGLIELHACAPYAIACDGRKGVAVLIDLESGLHHDTWETAPFKTACVWGGSWGPQLLVCTSEEIRCLNVHTMRHETLWTSDSLPGAEILSVHPFGPTTLLLRYARPEPRRSSPTSTARSLHQGVALLRLTDELPASVAGWVETPLESLHFTVGDGRLEWFVGDSDATDRIAQVSAMRTGEEHWCGLITLPGEDGLEFRVSDPEPEVTWPTTVLRREVWDTWSIARLLSIGRGGVLDAVPISDEDGVVHVVGYPVRALRKEGTSEDLLGATWLNSTHWAAWNKCEVAIWESVTPPRGAWTRAQQDLLRILAWYFWPLLRHALPELLPKTLPETAIRRVSDTGDRLHAIQLENPKWNEAQDASRTAKALLRQVCLEMQNAGVDMHQLLVVCAQVRIVAEDVATCEATIKEHAARAGLSVAECVAGIRAIRADSREASELIERTGIDRIQWLDLAGRFRAARKRVSARLRAFVGTTREHVGAARGRLSAGSRRVSELEEALRTKLAQDPFPLRKASQFLSAAAQQRVRLADPLFRVQTAHVTSEPFELALSTIPSHPKDDPSVIATWLSRGDYGIDRYGIPLPHPTADQCVCTPDGQIYLHTRDARAALGDMLVQALSADAEVPLDRYAARSLQLMRGGQTATLESIGALGANSVERVPLLGRDDMTAEMRSILMTMTPEEERTLSLAFGVPIEQPHDHTLEEVGQDFEVTLERIREIEAKVQRKRRRSRAKGLRASEDTPGES